MKTIERFEHEKLNIGQEGFTKQHWEAFVKYNELHNNQFFDVLYNGIRFKQFVGIIQIGNFVVEILPKADKNDSNTNWQNVLLPMLKVCGRIKAKSADAANLKRQNLNLLEVYFDYYLREIEQLIHAGLVKKYRKETGNVKALKGKLDFAGNIRHNIVHKERFYTTHQVYDVNHKLHQVLNLALEIVDQFSSGSRINDVCKRIRMSFPDVAKVNVNEQILNSITLDRKTAPYERALELAKFITLNYSPDIKGGNQKMIALLFDMNQLWEEYVYVTLRKEIQSDSQTYEGYTIKAQHSKYFWGNNSLQPDIVLTKGETKFIIDTKWKIPGNSASIEDLRQMYAYARFWKAKECLLLYPGETKVLKSNLFLTDDYHLINDKHEQINHSCKMGFVSVTDKDGNLDDTIAATILKMIIMN
jgi:5-methylcytosine-specific restriction enzyme subunit McrC